MRTAGRRGGLPLLRGKGVTESVTAVGEGHKCGGPLNRRRMKTEKERNKMSKLYVSCLVVALLALAVMPAMAQVMTETVTVSATVPEYINLDDSDLTIEFVNGEMLDGNTAGYVVAADTAWYTLSTNTPIWVKYENGSDLALDGTGYKLELQFSGKTAGQIDWTGGHAYAPGGDTYSPWGGCGADKANAPDSGLGDQAEDTGSFGIEGCQTLTFTTQGRLYQAGIVDPAGSYTQVAADLLTLTMYDNESLTP